MYAHGCDLGPLDDYNSFTLYGLDGGLCFDNTADFELCKCFNWIQLIPVKDNFSDLYCHSFYTAYVASTCSLCLHVAALVLDDRKAHTMGQYRGVVALHHSDIDLELLQLLIWHITATSSICSGTVGAHSFSQTHHTATGKWSPDGTLITDICTPSLDQGIRLYSHAHIYQGFVLYDIQDLYWYVLLWDLLSSNHWAPIVPYWRIWAGKSSIFGPTQTHRISYSRRFAA